MAKRVLVRVMAEVARHPPLKAKAASLINRYPDLKARLKGLAVASGGDSALTMVEGPQDLSLRARRVYTDLLEAVEKNKTAR
jgi:hypothetical protein